MEALARAISEEQEAEDNGTVMRQGDRKGRKWKQRGDAVQEML